MRRATVNFWIDAVIAVAFLISGGTGILFLLPVNWRSVSDVGGPAMLGVSIAAWHTLHDWSGIVAVAGVVTHGALHLRWFMNIARRMARGGESAGEGTAARPATRWLPTPSARVAAPPFQMPASPARTPATVRVPAPATTAAVVATSADDRRISRRAFVVGFGTAVGTAAVPGVGALTPAACAAIACGSVRPAP